MLPEDLHLETLCFRTPTMLKRAVIEAAVWRST